MDDSFKSKACLYKQFFLYFEPVWTRLAPKFNVSHFIKKADFRTFEILIYSKKMIKKTLSAKKKELFIFF